MTHNCLAVGYVSVELGFHLPGICLPTFCACFCWSHQNFRKSAVKFSLIVCFVLSVKFPYRWQSHTSCVKFCFAECL